MPAFIKVDRLCGSFLFSTDLYYLFKPVADRGSSSSSMINSRSSLCYTSCFPPRLGFLGGSCPAFGLIFMRDATAFWAFYFFVSSCLNLAFSILASIASSLAYSVAYLSSLRFSAALLASVSFLSWVVLYWFLFAALRVPLGCALVVWRYFDDLVSIVRYLLTGAGFSVF